MAMRSATNKDTANRITGLERRPGFETQDRVVSVHDKVTSYIIPAALGYWARWPVRGVSGVSPRLMDDILCEGAGCIRRGNSVCGTWIHDLQLLMQGMSGSTGPAFMFMISSILFSSVFHERPDIRTAGLRTLSGSSQTQNPSSRLRV